MAISVAQTGRPELTAACAASAPGQSDGAGVAVAAVVQPEPRFSDHMAVSGLCRLGTKSSP
jgi:hypothetical protein